VQVEKEGKRVVNFGVFACKTIVLRAVRYTLGVLTPRGTEGHELKEVGCGGIRARRQDNGLEETQEIGLSLLLVSLTHPLFSKSPIFISLIATRAYYFIHLQLNTILDDHQRKGHYRSHGRSVGSRDCNLKHALSQEKATT
jgi:hypothetical protein